jgi:hypothetical protein
MAPRAVQLLKRDALGRVELLDDGSERRIRRVAGGRLPGSALVARLLLARERRALAALAGLAGVPRLELDPRWAAAPGLDGLAPAARDVLVRSYLEGSALHQAEVLPLGFFERLDELVAAAHARGVCHNDLHKEQNVLVGADGAPGLLDFQLASVHLSRGRAFRIRCGDDRRHVQKHARRYTRAGRGPAGALLADAALPRRSFAAAAWRALVKPVYNRVGLILGLRDREERRASSGPWPRWVDAAEARRERS